MHLLYKEAFPAKKASEMIAYDGLDLVC